MVYIHRNGTWVKTTKKAIGLQSPGTIAKKRAAFERKKLTPAFKRWRAKQYYGRQHGKCAYCFHPISGALHTDHFIPLSRKGTSAYNNLRVCCEYCNYYKGMEYPYPELIHKLAMGVACNGWH